MSWHEWVFGLGPDLGGSKKLLALEDPDRTTSNLCGAKCINSVIFSLLSYLKFLSHFPHIWSNLPTFDTKTHLKYAFM